MVQPSDRSSGSSPGAADNAMARRIRMLRTAMGPEIAAALADPEVVEVLLNPDGSLWVDRLGTGRAPTGVALPSLVAERIIRLVATHVRAEVHAGTPILSAELPETGERFLGVLPPVVRAPSFAIRKRAVRIMNLAQYVADGILTEDQAGFLRQAVRERLNIVVAGGTSTGKTTLANALLDEIAETRDRVLILEDTLELQCRSDDHVSMRTEPGVTTMADLVRATLRLRPDRIVVGEVRGAEALDLLKAWGTGHPGGIATVHAGSALGALTRLEQLVQEVSVTVPRTLIAEAVHVIVFIAGRGRARRVREIARHRPRQRGLPARYLGGAWLPVALLISSCPFHPVVFWRNVMTFSRPSVKPLLHAAVTAMLLLAVALPARAAGSNMPWEAPLQSILDSIQGPVAKIVAVIIIIVTGLTLAFGDTSGGFRRLIQIVFGLSIAFAASSFFLTFFSFSGGAVLA